MHCGSTERRLANPYIYNLISLRKKALLYVHPVSFFFSFHVIYIPTVNTVLIVI